MAYESKIPRIMRDAARQVDRANRLAAERVADAARESVARDTGRTARSIDAGPLNGATQEVRVEALRGGEGNAYEVHVDFPGHLLEFGTAKMAARPFLVPAAEAERTEHARAVRAAWQTTTRAPSR